MEPWKRREQLPHHSYKCEMSPPFGVERGKYVTVVAFLFLSLEEEPPMWFIPNLLSVETDQTSTVFPFKNII